MRKPAQLIFVSIALAALINISIAAQNKKRIENTQTAKTSIRSVLDDQVKAWNAADLEKFMTGYWRSQELTFFSGGRKLSGWEATLDRYRKTYQAEGREMGKLDFSELDIEPLSDKSAVVRGRWRLRMSDGKELGGLYTLIFKKFDDGWKIVHDHTSSNQ